MDQAVKEQWVAALRSGEYEKGKGWLENDGHFCCLGVLSHLAHKAGACPRVQHHGRVTYGATPAHYYLPEEVKQWAGLEEGAGDSVVVKYMGYPMPLASLNDNQFNDFGPIADLIEEQL